MRPASSHPFTLSIVLALLASWTGCAGDVGPWPVAGHELAVSTVCGGGTTIEGVDVSKWQGDVDWPAVAGDGIHFGFARVSDGLNTPDATFATNWQGMKQAGVIRGAYQFFRPSQDAAAQADKVIAAIADAGGLEVTDLPPVLDVETDSGLGPGDVAAKVQAWVARIEAQLKRRPIIYSGSYFWDDEVSSTAFADYPLWTAHYTNEECPYVADAWQKWVFWQYTDRGSVAGIEGNVDRNRFDGDLDGLRAFVASTAISTGPPPCVPTGPEICGDGVDNDCQNGVDDGCEPSCVPEPERCNGRDDDCNGVADEGDPDGGGVCEALVGGAPFPGIEHCVGGQLVCQPDAPPVQQADYSRLRGGCALGPSAADQPGWLAVLLVLLMMCRRRRR